MTVAYFRGTRQEAVRVINSLRLALTGQGSDDNRIARGVFVAMGLAALSDIQRDFIRKARGDVGEDGVKWAPLQPATLAYSRRFGRGEKTRLKQAAGLNRGHSKGPTGSGLLNSAQLKSWIKHYRQSLAWLATKHDMRTAKNIAASIAWNKVKAEGAKTMLEVYGNRPHEILRDTGVLLNSLSPGQIGGDGASYRKPGGDGGDDQVFELIGNGVIVGTNVGYAATHQNGSTKKNIPARPFLPKKAPVVWIDRWSSVLSKAFEVGLRLSLEGSRGRA